MAFKWVMQNISHLEYSKIGIHKDQVGGVSCPRTHHQRLSRLQHDLPNLVCHCQPLVLLTLLLLLLTYRYNSLNIPPASTGFKSFLLWKTHMTCMTNAFYLLSREIIGKESNYDREVRRCVRASFTFVANWRKHLSPLSRAQIRCLYLFSAEQINAEWSAVGQRERGKDKEERRPGSYHSCVCDSANRWREFGDGAGEAGGWP